MSVNRDKFHKRLTEILPTVHYNASENTGLKYPCITYKPSFGETQYANNRTWINYVAYEVTLLTDTYTDDDVLIQEFMEKFNLIEFKNQFVSDGIAHAVFTIYNTL
jgi:hypothetical protein